MDGRHIGILLPISILTYSVCVIIHMSCCIRLRNFVVNGQTSTDFWRHIDFLRWRSWSQKYTSEFRFSDCFRSKWWKSMCIQNLDEISQSTVEIILLPVWENGLSPYWNSNFCFNFDPCVSSACDFVSACQISSQSDIRRRSYDVISIFQDGGHRVWKLLPCSALVIAFV